MKIFGIVIICTASAALGFAQGEHYRKHYQELIYLKKIMLLIRGEIRYNCGVLSEVFANVAGRVKEPYREIFEGLSGELDSGNGKVFSEIWDNTVIMQLDRTLLWKDDIEELKELGDGMGYLDMEMQLNCIDFYTDKLADRIQLTGERLKGNEKLFKVLGIMGGILITVLLI